MNPHSFDEMQFSDEAYLELLQQKRLQREARRKRIRRNRIIALSLGIAAIFLLMTGLSQLWQAIFSNDGHSADAAETTPHFIIDQPKSYISHAAYTGNTAYLTGELSSEYAILINLNTNEVVAAKNAEEQMLPASMTKVMTAWLACEQISDFSETYTMTAALIDPLYRAGLTTSGFKGNEPVTLGDLLYTTVLYSAADSAKALAIHCSESEEAFIEQVNQRFSEMGLSNTHFTNVSGAYDAEHYTTAHEMALIMANAVQDPICLEALSQMRHTSTSTDAHPQGLDYINQFLYRLQHQELNGATAVAAKSGYLSTSGSTACSYGYGESGQSYVCVTAKAQTSWKTVYDHEYLYATYAK